MSNTSKITIAALIGAALVTGAMSVSAQQATSPASSEGTMNHHGMQGGDVMPMMGMMQQMSEMMANCDRMMQSHLQGQGTGSGQQEPAPQPQQGDRG